MASRRPLLALTIAALAVPLALPAPAAATSLAAIPPHKPERACAVVARLLERLATTKDAEDDDLFDALVGVRLATDALGDVEVDEWPALLAALRTHEGKADKRPLHLTALRRIHDDAIGPLYVAIVEREQWELERYMGEDGMLMPVFERDPHYEAREGFWLVGFRGNDVASLREADELYPLARGGEAHRDCRGAADPEWPLPVMPEGSPGDSEE